MIVPIKGKVKYSITLDPTVWIFDDRKIVLEEAFVNVANGSKENNENDSLERAAERFNREVYGRHVRPPVNKSLNRFEREKALVHSYVMPINDFVTTCEIKSDASRAILKTDGNDVIISLEQLQDALFLFSNDGKPLKDDGPVHLYFGDGSNQDEPIKNVKQIIVE